MTVQIESNEIQTLRRRLTGLENMIGKKLHGEYASDRQMSERERRNLTHIQTIVTSISEDCDSCLGCARTIPPRAEIVRNSQQYLNTQCEFFDLNANRIQCAIGCDMYRCSKRCIYATNVPGSLPPYGTKYMKGRM